jgi:hypothetical protein
VLVQAKQLGLMANTKPVNQVQQSAGVFGGDVRQGRQRLDEAWAGVLKVADGCCRKDDHALFSQTRLDP